MRRDERVFCIGEDIGIEGGFGGAFTATLGLSKEFGHDRVLDTPISEAGYTGIAVGAALMGMRPIVDFQYSDFLFCAMDQIVNNMAKLRYMSGGKLKKRACYSCSQYLSGLPSPGICNRIYFWQRRFDYLKSQSRPEITRSALFAFVHTTLCCRF